MSLADKMFARTEPGCGFGTDCRTKADRNFFSGLFAEDWEVFVIRHDANAGKYNWFTLCCEAVNKICNAKPKPVAAACC